MAPVIAARAKTGSSYVHEQLTTSSIFETMNDFDDLWRGNLSYNSDRWAKIKTAENRFARPSVMPKKPRILEKRDTSDTPVPIEEDAGRN